MALFSSAIGVAYKAALEHCLVEQPKQAAANISANALHAGCEIKVTNETSIVAGRLFDEQLLENNPFVITAHKPNYVLPLTYNTRSNQAPYADLQGELQHLEVKFQLSLKLQIADGVLGPNSLLFFAYTNQSYWQEYNKEFSSPFRETNQAMYIN